jgi:hypothetical protein
MDISLEEKKLRVVITGLETSQGHLRDLGFDHLADSLNEVLEQCNAELMSLVPDAEPGVLMKKQDQE